MNLGELHFGHLWVFFWEEDEITGRKGKDFNFLEKIPFAGYLYYGWCGLRHPYAVMQLTWIHHELVAIYSLIKHYSPFLLPFLRWFTSNYGTVFKALLLFFQEIQFAQLKLERIREIQERDENYISIVPKREEDGVTFYLINLTNCCSTWFASGNQKFVQPYRAAQNKIAGSGKWCIWIAQDSSSAPAGGPRKQRNFRAKFGFGWLISIPTERAMKTLKTLSAGVISNLRYFEQGIQSS